MINATTLECLASPIALAAVVLECSLDTHKDNKGGHKQALPPVPHLPFSSTEIQQNWKKNY